MTGKRRKGDRRQGYSFRGHFKRALETKGLAHILLSTFGTLVIAGAAFAYCSSSSITEPSSGGGSVATAPATGSPSGTGEHDDDDHFRPIDPGATIIPIDIGPPSAIETSFGPIILPIDMQATPCNHDVVAWDPTRTYMTMSGFMMMNPTSGVVHIRGHFTQRSQGVGTIVLPTRRYMGWQDYDKAFDLVPPLVANDEDYALKIIAKGNIEPYPLYPDDDFMMYVRVRTVMIAGVVRIESVKAYSKCW